MGYLSWSCFSKPERSKQTKSEEIIGSWIWKIQESAASGVAWSRCFINVVGSLFSISQHCFLLCGCHSQAGSPLWWHPLNWHLLEGKNRTLFIGEPLVLREGRCEKKIEYMFVEHMKALFYSHHLLWMTLVEPLIKPHLKLDLRLDFSVPWANKYSLFCLFDCLMVWWFS